MADSIQTIRDRVMLDGGFQAACQSYANCNGTSGSIAAAAIIALGGKVLTDIACERQRQIEAEGYDPAHDDNHVHGELARHAAVLAIYAALPDLDRAHASTYGPNHYGSRLLWPWAYTAFKLADRRRDLVKAAALIIAEVQRLDRIEG
ncbi:hypothetical protein [Novosphingobium olei]|uniref:hypothetical protein n=1 Tax=Novosphingobium olei TaxID=2728851 RepID=UPI00308548E9|nr:hypothetical protein NSDW_33300 [Novosphingobium olei]